LPAKILYNFNHLLSDNNDKSASNYNARTGATSKFLSVDRSISNAKRISIDSSINITETAKGDEAKTLLKTHAQCAIVLRCSQCERKLIKRS